MINKILKDIDNEECYYVGTNGCLYQDLGKEELLAIKQEIERLKEENKKYNKWIESLNKDNHRLNNIINELEQWLEEQKHFIINTPSYTEEIKVEHKIMFNDYENVLIKIEELKGSDKE